MNGFRVIIWTRSIASFAIQLHRYPLATLCPNGHVNHQKSSGNGSFAMAPNLSKIRTYPAIPAAKLTRGPAVPENPMKKSGERSRFTTEQDTLIHPHRGLKKKTIDEISWNSISKLLEILGMKIQKNDPIGHYTSLIQAAKKNSQPAPGFRIVVVAVIEGHISFEFDPHSNVPDRREIHDINEKNERFCSLGSLHYISTMNCRWFMIFLYHVSLLESFYIYIYI